MRLVVGGNAACCEIEKRCCAPYSAGAELRKMLNSWAHFLAEVRRFVKYIFKRVDIDSRKCAGKERCMWKVSMSHPNILFCVEKEASPFCSFEAEIAARRVGWAVLAKMASMACRKDVNMACCAGGCAIVMKSSIYTSLYASGGCKVDPKTIADGWYEECCGRAGCCIFAYKECGGGGGLVVFAISVTVSVKAQKYGGLCDHPMGSVRGTATKDRFGSSDGMTTAKRNAVDGDRGTW
jgi:hypothetical protein